MIYNYFIFYFYGILVSNVTHIILLKLVLKKPCSYLDWNYSIKVYLMRCFDIHIGTARSYTVI